MNKRSVIIRNTLAIAGIEIFWSVGVWMANPMTVLPNFLIRFGASPEVIGLLPAAWGVGLAFGALIAARLISGHRRVQITIGILHYLAIIPYGGLAILAWAAGRYNISPVFGQCAVIGLILAFNMAIGPVLQLYFVLLSRVLPDRDRGRLFGMALAAGTLAGLAGPLLAGQSLASPGSPWDAYARIFGGAFLLFCVGNAFIFALKEKESPPLPARAITGNIRAMISVWKRNNPLRRYIYSRFLLDSGLVAGAFFTTYSRLDGALDERSVTLLGILLVAGQAGGSFFLGWMTRNSRGPSRYLAAQLAARVAVFISMLLAALGPAVPAACLLAFSAGLLSASDMVINPNILMEMGPVRNRTDLITLGTIMLSPALLIMPTIAGAGIGRWGHRPVYMVASVICAAGLVMLWRLFRDIPVRRGAPPVIR